MKFIGSAARNDVRAVTINLLIWSPIMPLFLSSFYTFSISKKAVYQSKMAFEAEISTRAFYNAKMHLDMAWTIVIHVSSSITNLSLVCYLIFHVAFNIIDEDEDLLSILYKGIGAIALHFVAAAIDFANIFFTIAAITLRSIVSLINGYMEDSTPISSVYEEETSARQASSLQFSMS